MSEEDLATESQVRCFTALMHRLAEAKNRDYREVRQQIKERFGYSNLSKVGRETISGWIDQLESELDGQNAENAENTEDTEDTDPDADPEPNVNGHADTNADVDEHIRSYMQILAQIYDAVQKEGRIPDSDRLFAVRLVFEAVSRDRRSRLIAELRR